MMALSFYELEKLSPKERALLCTRTESDLTDYIERVKPILQEVQHQGDRALLRYAELFDHARLESVTGFGRRV